MSSPSLVLVIGNRNYSSWSLRSWLLMRQFSIPFEEKSLPLSTEEFRRQIAPISPAGRVPVLIDGGFAVWDTLAIAEYLAERHPSLGIWPADSYDRARARSICSEMHSGFASLRSMMPFNVEARLPGLGWNVNVQADIDRIVHMWSELRAANASAGPFLFGRFCAADAFYAPIVSRLDTYAVKTPPVCDEYRGAVQSLAAMREWCAAARAEATFIAADEPYRRSRGPEPR